MSHSDESPLRQVVRNTVAAICERFGNGGMALGGDPGTLHLDGTLGNGGLPLGCIVEIYGPASSGKTTLTLRLIAEAQRRGLVCAFIDGEHALDVQVAGASASTPASCSSVSRTMVSRRSRSRIRWPGREPWG